MLGASSYSTAIGATQAPREHAFLVVHQISQFFEGVCALVVHSWLKNFRTMAYVHELLGHEEVELLEKFAF